MLLVFGSINMDILVQTSGFPEAGETLMGETYQVLDGGKGSNQAIAAKYAGASRVYMVGCAGNDRFGDDVVRNMRVKDIVTSGIARSDRSTGLAIVCVNEEGENSIILSPGANLDTKADQVPDDFLKVDSVLLMQMEILPHQNWAMLEKVKKTGALTMLNVAPASAVPESALNDLDYVIVNEIEAKQLALYLSLAEREDPRKIAEELAKKHNLVCVVTLSEKGGFASDRGQKTYQTFALTVDAVDSTGAGDAFCGTFAAAIEQGFSLSYALHRASVAGGLACLKYGAQQALPTNDEIENYLENCQEPEVL